MRVYAAPHYATALWRLENDQEILFDWDEARGRRQFEAALKDQKNLVAEKGDAGKKVAQLPPHYQPTCFSELPATPPRAWP